MYIRHLLPFPYFRLAKCYEVSRLYRPICMMMSRVGGGTGFHRPHARAPCWLYDVSVSRIQYILHELEWSSYIEVRKASLIGLYAVH